MKINVLSKLRKKAQKRFYLEYLRDNTHPWAVKECTQSPHHYREMCKLKEDAIDTLIKLRRDFIIESLHQIRPDKFNLKLREI